MAGLFVIPIDQENIAVGSISEIDKPCPSVVGQKEIRAMSSVVTGSLGLQVVHIQTPAVNVAHEPLVAIFLGSCAAQVNHRAAMGVSAAGTVGSVVTPMGRGADIVDMVRNGGDVRIRERIEMVSGLSVVACTLDDVERMRNDAGLTKSLAVIVEVQTPRIAGAMGEHFENMLRGMIAPNAGIDRCPLRIGRSWFAHTRVREHAVAAVQPAVRSPGEGIQCLVSVLPGPTIQQYLRRSGWFIFAGFDWHE